MPRGLKTVYPAVAPITGTISRSKSVTFVPGGPMRVYADGTVLPVRSGVNIIGTEVADNAGLDRTDVEAPVGSDGDVPDDFRLLYFGTGTANTTISTTVELSGQIDGYYNNLTLNSGGLLRAFGRRIFVRDTLTLNGGRIEFLLNTSMNGGSPTGTTGGGAGGVTDTLSLSRGYSAATAGANGSATLAVNGSSGGSGVGSPHSARGGSGGANGAAQAGGLGGTTTVFEAPSIIRFPAVDQRYGETIIRVGNGYGGTGGGSGRSDGTSDGPGGGGGGHGGTIFISARRIMRGPSSGAGAISARGGNGGNGKSPIAGNRGGGGGGGGGSGGYIILMFEELLGSAVTDLLIADGGNGGNGGNGSGTGSGGFGGEEGRSGVIQVFNLATGVHTFVPINETTNTAGAAPSGATGGTGGTGRTCRYSL